MGTNPKTFTVTPASAAKVGATIEFTDQRNKTAMIELTYVVERSDTLAPPWSSVGVTEMLLSDNGIVQIVKASLPAGSGGKRLVRLNVTRPERTAGAASGKSSPC